MIRTNINDINIDGRPEELSRLVQDLDNRMQHFAMVTEEMKVTIFRYGDNNYGKQYQKMCDAVKEMSANVCEASQEINAMQVSIVNYENKCHAYEDETNYANTPAPFMVEMIEAESDTKCVQVNKEDMIEVVQAIENYVNNALDACAEISDDRDNIGTIWHDSQFNDFSEFIDETIEVIRKGSMELVEYRKYLKMHIIALEN